jgi:hypothetical protein
MNEPGRFFIVGAQRSGTTYLYTMLDEHPQICMAKPVRPEPKFFLRDGELRQGLTYYEQKFFQEAKEHTLIYGEKSTSYCEHEIVAQKIKNSYPMSRILFILRNPVHRALSNFFFSRQNGLETRTLEEVFLDKKYIPEVAEMFVSPFNYLGRGEYLRYLKAYLKYFHKSRLKILIMEEFVGRLEKIQELYSYLGVDKNIIPRSFNQKIHGIEKQYDMSIPKEILLTLQSYFAPHIVDLEDFLQFDLTVWKEAQ